MKLKKLGLKVKEIATGVSGILTHAAIHSDETVVYWFRPNGLNSDTGSLPSGKWITPNRVGGGRSEEVNIPASILLTEVEHKHSGFKGIVTELQLHINGCVHAYVQPVGLDKNGDMKNTVDFSTLELDGKAIKKLTQAQKANEKKKNPSPCYVGISR
jgi:hypothetical protein